MSTQTISWYNFAKAYANCVAKFAEFSAELAVEAHQELNLPYVDPFTTRSRRVSESEKHALTRTKHQDAFVRFMEVIRKKEPFLRKATEQELEGIFVRLTTSEKLKYSEVPLKRPSPVKKVLDDFLADEEPASEEDFLSSDDVSLVSESGNELDEPVEVVTKKKKKKEKKEDRKKSVVPMIKKFSWT